MFFVMVSLIHRDEEAAADEQSSPGNQGVRLRARACMCVCVHGSHKLHLNDSLYRSSPCLRGENWEDMNRGPSYCRAARAEPCRRNWGQQTEETV